MASEYQKRLLKEQQSRASQGITMSNDPRKKSSSSSSKPSSTSRTVVVYDSQGRITQSNDPTKPVGLVDPTKVRQTVLTNEPNLIGKSVVFQRDNNVITRKVFGARGLESSSIVQDKNTPSNQRRTTSQLASESRGIKLAQQSMAFKKAERKVIEGTATSKDLINYASYGTGRVQNILANTNLNEVVRSRLELDNFKNEVAKQMSPQQKSYYNTLSQSEKGKYLLQIASRRQQPTQDQIVKPVMSKPKKLSKLSNVVSSKLENWANNINKRGYESEKRLAKREADIVSRTLARDELVSQYVPTGFKTVGKGINALINLGEKTFTGTLGFGEALASAGEKAIFLLPALGQSISRGDIKRFGAEFVTTKQKKVLKDIYFGPKTYRDALIGAGVMLILGGIKSGKLTAKNVKKIPRTGKGYSKGTILKDVKGNVGYVSKTGIVKPIPKGLRTVTRALTRPTREFIFRNVKLFPKTSTAKVGTVFRNQKGELRVVTKGGRVIKPKPFERRLLVKDFKKGTRARFKATEKARTIAKAKAEAIRSSKLTPKTSRILKARGKEIKLKQIQKEINTFIKRFNVQGARKTEFTKAYKKYRLNPTDKNAGILKKISDNIEVDRGTRFLDSIIKKDLARSIKKSNKIKIQKDLISKKLSTRQFLKENKIKVKVVSENEMLRLQLQSPTLKAKLIKEAAKTGKITLPYGTTDGNTIWLLKVKSYKNGWTVDKILRHEAIHILKGDVKALQTSRFPSFKRVILEKRTDLLTRFNYKFPSKTKISQLKSIQIKKGLSKSTTKKVNQLMKKTDLTKKETIFLKKALKKEVKELKLRNKIKSKLSKDIEISQQFQARIKADSQAQAKGFKNYEEQFRYEKAFREYQRGNPRAENILKSIEKKIAIRKSKASKARARELESKRKKIILRARELLQKGKIALKEQVKPQKLKIKKAKFSNDEMIKLSKEIDKKLNIKSNLKDNVVKSDRLQLVQKQRIISKTKNIKKTIQKLKNPRLARLSSIGAVLFVSQDLLNRSKKRLAFAQSRFQDLAPTQKQDLVNKLKLDLRKVQNLQQDVNNLQDLGTDLTQLQTQGLKQYQRQAVNLKQNLQQVLKQVTSPRKIVKKATPPLIVPKIPKTPKITWDTKLPKNYSLLVDARYKKGNKVFTRRLRTTPNRARKLMNRFVDNNIIASYDLIIVGAKKIKDIKKPSMQKFTIRKGKNPKVRINVEKVKYRLDRPREKAISKLRRKKYAKKNKGPSVRKRPSKKRFKRKRQ